MKTLEDYIAKYGVEDGTRRWKEKEYHRAYYQRNREKIRAEQLEYRLAHSEEKKIKDAEYRDSHKEMLSAYKKQYRKDHSEEIRGKLRLYYQENKDKWHQNYMSHKEEKKEYNWQYRNTMSGRATNLVNHYIHNDLKENRGDCTLTPQWIVNNIFTKKCLYCGESDWHKLGCDRIDNNKPHTPNNVVCCCKECNKKRARYDFLEYAYSIGARDSEGLTIQYKNERL